MRPFLNSKSGRASCCKEKCVRFLIQRADVLRVVKKNAAVPKIQEQPHLVFGDPFEVKDELFTCLNVTVLLCPL